MTHKNLATLVSLVLGANCWAGAPEVVAPACQLPAPLEGKWSDQAPGYIVMLTDEKENTSVVAERLARKYGFTVEGSFRHSRMFTVSRFAPDVLAKLRCDPSIKLVEFNAPTHLL
jgi:hypothetical protein